MSAVRKRCACDHDIRREQHAREWGRNIDALQSTVADIDRTMADQHAASMKSLDDLIAVFEEMGRG